MKSTSPTARCRIYQVVDGEVNLIDVAPDATETLIGVIRAGSEFGEMGAVFDLQRAATARARTQAHVVGYTVVDFKKRFGVPHLMTLIARYAPDGTVP